MKLFPDYVTERLLETTDELGNTSLHRAIVNNDEKVVREWLYQHVDVDIPNPITFDTPLFIAVYNSNVKMVEILLDHGANIDHKHVKKNNFTVLHVAAQDGLIEMVNLLLYRKGMVDGKGEIPEIVSHCLYRGIN